MLNTAVIAWREYRAYFTSPIAYVSLATFLVAVAWLFFRAFFLIGQADLRDLFRLMPWIFLFFLPAIAMGKWADERKLGTLELLCTLPVRDVEIVMAKFLAGLALIATALALTLTIPLSVTLVGDLDWGPVVGGYVGLLFLGGAYLSVGLVVSSLTENQIIAFVVGVAVNFLLLVAGTPLVLGGEGGLLAQAIHYAALGTHFASIARGVIDSRDILYYCSAIGFFLWINVRIVGRRART